ncbi:hypothetical protein VKT23_016975, partial [Stygiomarasmius scandens]
TRRILKIVFEDFTEDTEVTSIAGRIRGVVSVLEVVRLVTSEMLAKARSRGYVAAQPEENCSADSEEAPTCQSE